LKVKEFSKSLALLAALLFAVAIVVTGCSGGATTTITEAGSTTVQPLAQDLADAFMADNPDVQITVAGGGSSVGVQSAADGTVDIGAASRALKPSEETLGLVVHILARDGIAIVSHWSQSITDLSIDQTREIFAGNITNWSQIGGADEEITVIAREEGSGTRAAFEEMVMGDDLVTANAILQSSNGALKTAVAGDPNSIGFLSFGYLDETVKAFDIDGVAATVENCINESYPIVRPLLFLTLGEPTGKVKEFIDFCLGTEGQAIVAEDYIPVI
jgi:phosphate transport system substrate-binding protein